MAALDSFAQSPAASLIASGVRSDVAESFLLPDGIFPRMRLLAWGWTKKGDRFKSPSDAGWWKRKYQFQLWAPIETYLDQVTRSGNEPPGIMWDDDLAGGDPAELSRSLPAVVQQDLPPVNEAPCPKWLIPPGRGMMPIANPSCADKDKIRDEVEKVHRPATGQNYWWLWLIAIGYLMTRKDK